MKIFQPNRYNPGNTKIAEDEEILDEIKFKIHKFTPRKRPANKSNVAIFPHFSEFGSELIESIYTLPMVLNGPYQGKYTIVLGWQGRAYLYKHLVDEFWEIGEEHQHLREYCRCFHHDSKNLRLAEKNASKYGVVVNAPEVYGLDILYPRLPCCQTCKGPLMFTDEGQICITCHACHHRVGIYNEIKYAKRHLAVWPPKPSAAKLEVAAKYLKPNSVGVTARHRTCYGRNLSKEFYEKLVLRLESLGYNPIWIGEKETTLRSPFDRIVDYCVTEDANDLETTLALVSQLKFTVQFWTASTRLAGMVGTPWLLVESPDQIWGRGQEGIRLNLCTKGKGKLVLAHYVNVNSDHDAGVNMVEAAIREMEAGDYSDHFGLVENKDWVVDMRNKNAARVGSI